MGCSNSNFDEVEYKKSKKEKIKQKGTEEFEMIENPIEVRNKEKKGITKEKNEIESQEKLKNENIKKKLNGKEQSKIDFEIKKENNQKGKEEKKKNESKLIEKEISEMKRKDYEEIIKNESLLANIKSNYIFESLFGYIKKESLSFKLFKYSKFFQNKLKIGIEDYQEHYIEQREHIDLCIPNYFLLNTNPFYKKIKYHLDDVL